MRTYQWVECCAGFEETIKEYGIHIAAKALFHAMMNVKGDAKHGIDDFELTPAYELMVKQVQVLEEAYNKIEKLRAR